MQTWAEKEMRNLARLTKAGEWSHIGFNTPVLGNQGSVPENFDCPITATVPGVEILNSGDDHHLFVSSWMLKASSDVVLAAAG